VFRPMEARKSTPPNSSPLPSSPLGRGSADRQFQITKVTNARLATSKTEIRYRNWPGRQQAADHGTRQGEAWNLTGEPPALWPLQGKGNDELHQVSAAEAERQAGLGARHYADASR